MKNTTILLLMLLLLSNSLFSQKTKSDVFNSTDIVWYGLDFSEAKLRGSGGFNDVPKIRNYYFNEWNHLMVREQDRYDIARAFKKANVEYNLSIIEERNKQVKLEGLVIDEAYTLDEDRIPEILGQYELKQTEGIGLVFIVESLNKSYAQAPMYVVFFDIANKTPLLVKKMVGEPSGFTFRSYWAGAVYDVLNQCRKAYPKWKKGK